MYHPVLDLFLAVAETGSISKGAAAQYISHTAAAKQIDQLEARLGIQLFQRTKRGVTLTPAGESFYQDSRKLIQDSKKAILRAQKIFQSTSHTIRLGTSVLYPSNGFMPLWNTIRKEYSNYQLKMIPVQDGGEQIERINKDIDFVIGAFDSQFFRNKFQFIPVGTYKFRFSMNRNHPLAEHDRLSLADLKGEHIMIMKQGDSPINDQIRLTIQQEYPNVLIEDIGEHYDAETFNNCAESNHILLSLECWDNIHPSLTSIPMVEDFSLPFGIICSSHPSEDMSNFIKIIKSTLS